MDSVQSRHQHRREGQIRIGCRIWGPILNTFGFGILAVGGNANGRAAIAAGVGQIHWRFIARHEPFVAVGGGIANGAEGPRMFEHASDVIERHLRQPGIFIARKERFAFFPEALVGVHPAAIVSKERLGHEGGRFAMPFGHVFNHILIDQHRISAFDQGVKAIVNLRLAGCGYFMVLALDLDSQLFHEQAHLGADVLLGVRRGHWKIAFLMPNFVTEVGHLIPAGVPDRFL